MSGYGFPHAIKRLSVWDSASLDAGSTAFMVAVSLAFVAVAGPLYDFSERAATVLLDRTDYIEAVLR